MIVNSGKSQSIIIESSKVKINLQSLKINYDSTETSKSVKLLRIEIGNHLNFQLHVSTICKKPAGQLNALLCSKYFLNKDQRNIIANSFTYSNVNYCPLIWHFCSQRLINNIANNQKCTLRFVLNDNTSNYETLLNKSDKCTKDIQHLQVLAK